MVYKSKKGRLGLVQGIGQKISHEAVKIKDDIPYKKFVYSAVFLNLLLIAVIFLVKNSLPPEVPLFYGLPEGQEQLASIYLLALPSVISTGIIFFNILLGIFVKDEFLVKILCLTGIATAFFSIVTTLKIILLVGSF
jgi:hypothetical protein